MDFPFVTVYLITYRQKDVLAKTLEGIFHQTYPRTRYEIVVLDDGSDDGTIELLDEMAGKSPVPVKILAEKHEADYLSAKRFNQCIAAASPGTEVFVHLEDALVRPDFLWQHVKWHLQAVPSLVSSAMFEGPGVTWDLAASDPDRRYLSPDGLPVECDFQAAWAKSLSFKRASIESIWKEPDDRPFDERMTGWGYHEIEFALRMKLAGVRIVYDPAAGVYHPPHTEITEKTRGFDRAEIVSKGEVNNIDYLCLKHGLDGLDEWATPVAVGWIDRTIWERAAEELARLRQ